MWDMPLTNEFDVIEEIRGVLGKPSSRVILGIGDDAAVTKPLGGKPVFTIDTMVEGVHFDLAYTAPRELGHKALAVNLSDLAAMGATPSYALVSLGLKQEMNEHFVTELYEGMKALAKKHSVDIIGGNLVQSPLTFIIDVVAIGQVAKNFFPRSGAKVGDVVAVTGRLGSSAAGLNCLRKLGRHEIKEMEAKLGECLTDHLMPEPRVEESLALQKLGGVTSMIDISDGLAKELHHIAKASGVGFLIKEKAIPVSKSTLSAAEFLGTKAMPWALYGGEDYELLFTAKKKSWPAIAKFFQKKRWPLSLLGEVTPAKLGVRIEGTEGSVGKLEGRGWNHFVRRRPAVFA